MVFAYSGTQLKEGKRDLNPDRAIARNLAGGQARFIDMLKLAMEFSKRYCECAAPNRTSKRFVTTGHSLGGSIALYVADMMRWCTVTFALGTTPLHPEFQLSDVPNLMTLSSTPVKTLQYHFRVARDPISMWYKPPDAISKHTKIYDVEVPVLQQSWWNPLVPHGKDNFLRPDLLSFVTTPRPVFGVSGGAQRMTRRVRHITSKRASRTRVASRRALRTRRVSSRRRRL